MGRSCIEPEKEIILAGGGYRNSKGVEAHMSMRKITSLTATLSFILTVTTSIILYIVPQGRVAYWSDWRMWGLTKTQWGDVHINVGLLFLLALFLHIYYNWKPLMAYLKDRSKRMVFFYARI
jgi:ABC-type Fe3+-siderophore transport system permease subunit